MEHLKFDFGAYLDLSLQLKLFNMMRQYGSRFKQGQSEVWCTHSMLVYPSLISMYFTCYKINSRNQHGAAV